MRQFLTVTTLLFGLIALPGTGVAQQGKTYTPPSGGNNCLTTTCTYLNLQTFNSLTAASPTFTGIPTAPTATSGTNTTQLATTAFVQSLVSSSGGGTVSNASVVTANGFSGTVANPTSTPAISIGTTITGLLKGNGSAVSAASAGTDYLAPTGSGAALTGINWSQLGSIPTTLAGYGISNAVASTVNLTGTSYGQLLTGGVNLCSQSPALLPTNLPTGGETTNLFCGDHAGQSYNIATPDQYGTVAIGAQAFANGLVGSGESVFYGVMAGQFITTGGANSCIGMHACGFDNPSSGTALGQDAARDEVGAGGTGGPFTCLGAGSCRSGQANGGVIAIGGAALGNSSQVTYVGNAVNGEVYNVTIAVTGATPTLPPYGPLTGLPKTYTYTAVGAATPATISTALKNAVSVGDICGPGTCLQTKQITNSDGSATVYYDFPGTLTTGWALSVTPTCTGCSSVATAGSGAVYGNLVAIGQGALALNSTTTVVMAGIVAIGNSTLTYDQTGTAEIAIGSQACQNKISGNNNICIGNNALAVNLTGASNTVVGNGAMANGTSSNDTAFGANTGSKVTTGNFNLLLGANVATTTLTTGGSNILLGVDAAADTPTNSTSNYFGVFGRAATVATIAASGTNTAAPLLSVGGAIINKGTPVTISGCGASTILGGASTGSFVSGTSGTCTAVITLAGAIGATAPNGWACPASDITTPADIISETAMSVTTVTLSGTTATNDVIVFHCSGF